MISKAFTLYKNSVSGLSRQIWLLSLVTFINRSGTMVVPFLGVYMTSELGFSIARAGWVLFFFGLGSLAGSYLGGWLTDKFNYYWVMFWSLFLGGLLFIVLGWAESFWEVCAMIFLVSTVGDAFRPAVMSSVAVYSTVANRTRAFSLIRMAVNFGWAMGPAIGGWLVKFRGYDSLFWVDGLTCVLAALVFWFSLQAKETALGHQNNTDEQAALSPYKDKTYLLFLFLTVIGAIVFMQFLYTLPIFYKEEMHFSEGLIGSILALNGLLIAITEMPLVYTLERKLRIIDNIWIGVLMFGIAYVMLNLATGPSLLIAVVSMVVLSIGEIFNMPFTNTYAMNRASDSNRGAYMGLFTMSYSVAHIIGPPIGTQTVAHFGFGALWYLMGTLSIVTVIGYLYLDKKEEKTSLTKDEIKARQVSKDSPQLVE